MGTFTARSLLRERLTPFKFLALTQEQKTEIKETRIFPPRLGKAGFGGVEVTYRMPRYIVAEK